MWRLRNIKELVENKVLKYDPVEIKVREATSDEPWGPTGGVLAELSSISYEYNSYPLLMRCIWERIQNPFATWRNVYKGLLVLDYLLKFGSERVSNNIQAHSYILQSLKGKEYMDDSNVDQSRNILHRVDEIMSLINEPPKLEAQRLWAHEYKQRMNKTHAVQSESSKIDSKQVKNDESNFFPTKILQTVKDTFSSFVGSESESSHRDCFPSDVAEREYKYNPASESFEKPFKTGDNMKNSNITSTRAESTTKPKVSDINLLDFSDIKDTIPDNFDPLSLNTAGTDDFLTFVSHSNQMKLQTSAGAQIEDIDNLLFGKPSLNSSISLNKFSTQQNTPPTFGYNNQTNTINADCLIKDINAIPRKNSLTENVIKNDPLSQQHSLFESPQTNKFLF